jgi:hypothetical protein
MDDCNMGELTERGAAEAYDGSLSSEKPMYTGYEPNPHERFDAYREFETPAFDYKREIHKDYVAPVFRRSNDGWSTNSASFGIVPRKRIPAGVSSFDRMNARGISRPRNVASAAPGIACKLVSYHV